MAAFGAADAASPWLYHPLEILVRPAGPVSDLAERIATGLSADFRVALVRHGGAVVAEASPSTRLPLESSTLAAGLAVNGRQSLLHARGHLDLPTQRLLLSDADFVVVEARVESDGPTIVELEPDGSGLQEALASGVEHPLAAVGPHRPLGKLPPGGIPWFAPDDPSPLLEHLRDHFETSLRARPVWGLLLGGGPSDPASVGEVVAALSGCCQRVFADPSATAHGAPAEPLLNAHGGLGELGQILTALEVHPSASILAVRPGTARLARRIHALVERRDPFRAATAFREPDTHLPSLEAVLWEPKARARLYLGLAAGIRCPQRLLTHSHILLLDP